MTIPSDKSFEILLQGLGIKTDTKIIEIEKDVLLSVARYMFMVGLNFEKGDK